jgi:hypothetical protein
MLHILGTLAWRSLLCAALAWLGWRFIGLGTIALTIPLFAAATARPLLELAVAVPQALRARALADIEGRHYAFRGVHVRVIEDPDHRRWVRAADVRRITGGSDTDHALQLAYGRGLRVTGRPAEPYFSESALLLHLSRQGNAGAGRLRLWAERVVVGPARLQRQRLGLGTPAPASRRNGAEGDPS